MPEGVRLQNLRDFTVQIRNAADQIVGTGIAVSMDGQIVTCRHVVEAAIKSQAIDGADVGVYFPQARGGEEKKRKACVEKYFPQHDDDIVLLQLADGPSPLAPEQIPVLGMAELSEGNPFRTYGYSPVGNYPATRGDGTILGLIEPPIDRNLQADPVQLKSRDIAAGMSGAAVLDATRNLVVGLVAERFYSPGLVQDDIGYGVDSKVLTFDPFEFLLRGENLALKPAPEFKLDKDLFAQAVEIGSYAFSHRKADGKYSWNNAPAVLPEWIGRKELLAHITDDWNNLQKHVAGLIGFGGEGKSSLARQWVEQVSGARFQVPGGVNLTPETSIPDTPEGIFWWGFYENRSVDEFLEAALNYLSGGRIDPKQVQSSSLRAQLIGAMLGAGKYLFVLDGLEVLQHQDSDQYGLLQNNDLRDLLTYFARPDNRSFCLITSRAPLLDLMDYTTYSHRDVDRLSEADGIALLDKLRVKGSNEQKSKVVSDWDGHALTISLLGSYLAEKHGGDLAHLAELPVPTADEPRYERVHRVLRRYDEHLTQPEREFLKLFSAFRTPLHEDAFDKVFKPLLTTKNTKNTKEKPFLLRALGALGGSKKTASDSQFTDFPITEMVKQLVTYRIIKHDPDSQTYTAHPLVHNHYLAILTHDTGAPEAHTKIKDYYLSVAGDTPTFPTLEDLKPLIEVVHHACQAEEYDNAWKIYWERICQQDKYVLMHQLGAYETELTTMYEFFPDKDLFQEVPGSNPNGNKRWIPNTIGLCLMSLGRLREALLFYERAAKSYLDAQEWSFASTIYQNLAELHTYLGTLDESAAAARQALDLARTAEDKRGEWISSSYQASARYLLGDIVGAGTNYQDARKLVQESENSDFLYGSNGIKYAEFLTRSDKLADAKSTVQSQLRQSESNHWSFLISQCHRVLGDLDFDSNNSISAQVHYETALKIARRISYRSALIEALLACGRFLTKTSEVSETSEISIGQAFNDLNEALGYAVDGGYRIYEADIRVALAWAWLGFRDQVSRARAKAEAERALQMSKEMGYYWGKVDAEEVLGEIEKRIKDEG